MPMSPQHHTQPVDSRKRLLQRELTALKKPAGILSVVVVLISFLFVTLSITQAVQPVGILSLTTQQSSGSCSTPVFQPPISTNIGVTGEIVAGDFNGDGITDIAIPVRESQEIRVLISDGKGGIRTATTTTTDLIPDRLRAADLNHDGRDDLLMSGFGSAVAIIAYLSNPDGTLAARGSFAGRRNSVGDFNGDGTADILVSTNSALVLQAGDGNGNFGWAGEILPAGGSEMETGDFNSDGKPDVVAENGRVRLLLNDGQGGFTQVAVPLDDLSFPRLRVADFNRDAKDDLLIADGFFTDFIAVLTGDGTGGFTQTWRDNIYNGNFAPVIADFNQDGWMDYAVSNGNSSGTQTRLEIYLNDGQGGFCPTQVSDRAGALVGGDFNRDGKPDLAVLESGSRSLLLYLNCTGANTPPTITTFPVNITQGNSASPVIAKVSDAETPEDKLRVEAMTVPAGIRISFDNQRVGYASIGAECEAKVGANIVTLKVTDESGLSATADLVVNVTPNTPPEIRQAPEEIRIGEGFIAEIGFNYPSAADGVVQIFDAGSDQRLLRSYVELRIDGQPVEWERHYTFDTSFARIRLPRAGTYTLNVILKDRCGAVTRKDIRLVVAGDSAECSYPQFGASRTYGLGGTGSALVSGNFNNDGRADVAVLVGAAKQVRIYTGNADGTLSLNSDFSLPAISQSLAAGDFNGDGKTDLVVGAANSTSFQADPDDGISIFTGNGDATFSLSKSYRVGGGAIGVGDFNGDGRPDIASIEKRSVNKGRGVAILLNDGNGGFSDNPLTIPEPLYIGGAISVAVVDYDNDGYLDLVANNSSKAFSLGNLLTGDGKGGFRWSRLPGYAATLYTQSGDFNGDGKSDLAVVFGESDAPYDYWFINNLQILNRYYKGLTPRSLAAGDFNLDGKPDVALDSGAIMIGKGQDLFCAAPVLAHGGKVVAGDVNGDGKPDLIFAEQTGDLILQINNTVPAANTPPTITALGGGYVFPGSTDSSPRLIATVSDDNTPADNLKLEVISASAGISLTNLSISRGNVSAIIAADCSAKPGVNVVTLKVTDSGGLSATADLRVTVYSNVDFTPDSITIPEGLWGNVYIQARGDGKILSLPDSAAEFLNSLYSILGDSYYITKVGPPGEYTGRVFANTVCGPQEKTFRLIVTGASPSCQYPLLEESQAYPPIQHSANAMLARDFNGDGKDDLVIADTSVVAQMSSPDGGFRQTASYGLNGIARTVVAADFNRDGRLDVALTISESGNVNKGEVRILTGDGSGGFSEPVKIGDGNGPLATGDFNHDGAPDLVSGGIWIWLNDGTGKFIGTKYPVSNFISDSLAIFGEDIRSVSTSGDYFITLKGDGKGNFTTVTGSPFPRLPYHIFAGDFSGNGTIEQAVYFGQSRQADAVPNWLEITGQKYYGLGPVRAVADFNLDGVPDVVAQQVRIGRPGNTALMIGKNGGGYCAAPMLGDFSALTPGDFDGDGKTDLAVASSASSSVKVLLNHTGVQTNTPPTITTLPATTRQGSLAVTTVATVSDRETRVEKLKVQTESAPAGVSVFGFTNNNGSMTASVGADCNTAPGEYTVVLKAYDLDGGTATANLKVTVEANTPPALGAYPSEVTIASGGAIISPAQPPADNGSVASLAARAEGYSGSVSIEANGAVTISGSGQPGRYQVVVTATDNCGASSTQSFYFTLKASVPACERAGFNDAVSHESIGSPYALTSADFNGDGLRDLAVANRTGNSVKIMLGVVGIASHTFRPGETISLDGDPRYLATDDFNRDGRADLAIAVRGANSIAIQFGKGDGTFTAGASIGVNAKPTSLSAGDFNRDGKTDLVVVGDFSDNIAVLTGDGNGNFSAPVYSAAGAGLAIPAVADFNGDGNADVAVPNYSAGTIAILSGDGKGGFAPAIFAPTGVTGLEAVTAADFNNDGKTDLAVAGGESNGIAILLNNGAGGFSSGVSFSTGLYPASLAAGDYNGDGRTDLATANYSENTIAVLVGDGRGGINEAESLLLGTGDHPLGLIAGDFNDDGRADLAVADSGSDTVSVIVNNCHALKPPEMAAVSAANYKGMRLAAESIVAAFGSGLAGEVLTATALPLPTTLGGTTVRIKDSRGVERLAPLFFVSPLQINYQVPAGTAVGMATVTITNGAGKVTTCRVMIGKVSPGLFTADSSGQGVPSALLLRVGSDGKQSYEAVAEYDAQQRKFVARGIDLTNDQVFLLLFGTGLRALSAPEKVRARIGGVEAEVQYAGPQGSFIGLDQVNLKVPQTLKGRGEVEIELSVDGFATNKVRVSFR